jgi:hypothetical protein
MDGSRVEREPMPYGTEERNYQGHSHHEEDKKQAKCHLARWATAALGVVIRSSPVLR